MSRNPTSQRSGILAALAVKDFRNLAVANSISYTGTWIYTSVAAWVMLGMTSSPSMVGLVTSGLFLPLVLLLLPSGTLADRVSRKAVLIWTNLYLAIIGGILAIFQMTDRLTPMWLLGLAFMLGSGTAVQQPSYHGIVPDLLPESLIPAGISTHAAGVNVGRAIGPTLAGIFLALDQAGLAFLFNGVTYVALVFVAAKMRLDPEVERRRRDLGSSGITRPGYVEILKTPVVAKIVVVALPVALLVAPTHALLGPLVEEVLGRGALTFGILYGTFGVGALAGAAGLDTRFMRRRQESPLWRMILISSIAGVVLGTSPFAVVSGVALIALGASWLSSVATLNSTVQLAAPGRLRGRALGMYLLSVSLGLGLGQILVGYIAEAVGPGVTIAIVSMTGAPVAFWVWRQHLPSPHALVDKNETSSQHRPPELSKIRGDNPIPELIDVREEERFDAEKLATWIDNALPGTDAPLTVHQFTRGKANLTYQLRFGIGAESAEYVLRRPPLGPVAPSAHDMGREFRVLSTLWRAFPKAPRADLFCSDSDVIGAPFLIMERRHGLVVQTEIPEQFGGGRDSDANRALSCMVVDTLAEFHDADPSVAGLDDLGHPEGFLGRQVEGWTRRWEASRHDPVPLATEIATWLRNNMPNSGYTTLVHNDWRLDNLAVDEFDPGKCTAVYDWDMCTRGDPLADLGTAMALWYDSEELPETASFIPMPTTTPGFLTRAEAVERYGTLSGRDVSQMDWYLVFGTYKMAVVVQQIYVRWLRGQTRDERFAEFGNRVQHLLELAAERRQRSGAV